MQWHEEDPAPSKGSLPSYGKKVCRLRKSLYGLRQASRKWSSKLIAELLTQGFYQSKNDYSLLIKSEGTVLCQKKFTKELLQDCGFDLTKKVSTPLPLNVKLTFTDGTLLANPEFYRSIVVANIDGRKVAPGEKPQTAVEVMSLAEEGKASAGNSVAIPSRNGGQISTKDAGDVDAFRPTTPGHSPGIGH
ncbi:hypothetical protein AgCh_012505 [Apium graveolens]